MGGKGDDPGEISGVQKMCYFRSQMGVCPVCARYPLCLKDSFIFSKSQYCYPSTLVLPTGWAGGGESTGRGRSGDVEGPGFLGPLMKPATMKAQDDGLSDSGKWSEHSPVWVETKPKAPDSWDIPHARPKNTSSGL